MPRPLFDSEYIFGLHEPGGEGLMIDAGRPGWIVFTEELGRDPNNFSGKDFRPWSDRNLGILCRLNHGYHPNGTIPNSAFYADFARRCANYVAASPGCKLWIIGNEMNFAIERPSAFARSLEPALIPRSEDEDKAGPAFRGATVGIALQPAAPLPPAPSVPQRNDDPFFRSSPERFGALHPAPASAPPEGALGTAAADTTEPITPELYVRCYQLCRNAIRALPGHADDQVLIGAVAPWNNQTVYPGNPNGDWVQYFTDILQLLGPTGCDGITIHTYTHGVDPNLIYDASKMNPPFHNRHYHFRAYRDFMDGVPANMRHLPVYLTETDQDVPWLDANNGWVQRAYGEINHWNKQPGPEGPRQQIRAMVLYRWPNIDRWVIETKPGVIADFRQALANDYRWQSSAPPTEQFQVGDQLETTDIVNLRRTPGYVGKPSNDVLVQIPATIRITVLSSIPHRVDGLVWWHVRFPQAGQTAIDGWVAQTTPAGVTLVRKVQVPTPPPLPGSSFTLGEAVRTTTTVNLRRTPGILNKPPNDVVIGVPAETQLTVIAGPNPTDNLVWWRLQGFVSGGMSIEGWVAEKAPNGQALLVKAIPPGDGAPPPVGKFQIGDTVATRTVVRLRRSPGFVNKPSDDVIADIAQGVRGTVQGGPRSADNLTWWQVATTNAAGAPVTGWMAEAGADGSIFLEKVTGGGVTPPPVQGSFAIGELVTAVETVRVRRTPGTANKPADDVIGAYAPRATLNILEGPRNADNLVWWRVGGIMATGSEAVGWVAEKVGSATLVARPAKLAGTNIPDRASGVYLGVPFQGNFGISQLWGENPHIYGSISYDGVPLKGHNGIDFLTPTGTNILAVEDGVVIQAVPNDPSGLGNFIKLGHPWGESLYAHLESFSVQPGQSVRRGQVIGRADNTGFSQGPHLHFAIRINPYSRTDGWGGFSDPLPYMNPRDVILPPYVLEATPFRTLRPAGAPAPQAIEAQQRTLENAPGYAPDQPGVVRP